MARPLRIEFPGGLYHVTSRGDRQEEIYLDDADRTNWLTLFGHVCKRVNWVCHAYCLMDNHYHIVVETAEWKSVQGNAAVKWRLYADLQPCAQSCWTCLSGTIQSHSGGKKSYLLELSRYVVQNPVWAGRVNNVDQWPWSSYSAMIGKSSRPEWLQTDWILGQFGKQRKRAVLAYMDFGRAGVGLPSVWNDLRGQIYLGKEEFVETMRQHVQSDSNISEIPRAQRRAKAKPLSYYSSFNDRNAGIAAAYQTGDYTMKGHSG